MEIIVAIADGVYTAFQVTMFALHPLESAWSGALAFFILVAFLVVGYLVGMATSDLDDEPAYFYAGLAIVTMFVGVLVDGHTKVYYDPEYVDKFNTHFIFALGVSAGIIWGTWVGRGEFGTLKQKNVAHTVVAGNKKYFPGFNHYCGIVWLFWSHWGRQMHVLGIAIVAECMLWYGRPHTRICAWIILALCTIITLGYFFAKSQVGRAYSMIKSPDKNPRRHRLPELEMEGWFKAVVLPVQYGAIPALIVGAVYAHFCAPLVR